jgi:hypothetical protein
MVTVQDAAEELDGKSRKYFLGAYNNMNFPADSKKEQLTEYLELIRDDPVFWLQSLPVGWKGISALSRARAAVTSLLNCEKVVADHKDILQDVKKAFRLLLTVKVINDEIARRNDNESAEDYESDASDTECLELEDREPADADPRRDERLCPTYKDNLKQLCLEFSAQAGRDGVYTILKCLWNGKDDHSVDELVGIFRLIVDGMSDRIVFEAVHKDIVGKIDPQ